MKKKVVIPMILSATLLTAPFVTSPSAAAQTKTKDTLSTQVQAGKAESIFSTGLKSQKFKAKNKTNAISYLQSNKKKLGITNAQGSFKQKKVETDKLGMTHVRLQQTKNGVPVEGAEVTVHYSKAGEVQGVTGYYNDQLESAPLDTAPSISKEAALKTAKSAVKAPDVLEYDPTGELVVYPHNGKHYTAYKVNVNFLGKQPGNWFVFVDANTGKVIDQYNSIMDAGELTPSTGNGIGVKGILRKQLHISHTSGENGQQFFLKDISHPGLKAITTYDFKNQWDSRTVPLPGTLYSGNDASFRDKYDAAAVDAHYNSEQVYHFYKDELGRNSIDGKGGEIISTVHYGQNYNNAFWNGRQMTYGDGDNIFFIPLSAALDVAAHEMTHGVTTNTAGLIYRNQSGALNEAFSDIFGTLIDKDDWEVGEDAMAPAAYFDGRPSLRSLSKPDKYPVNAAYVPYGNGKGMYPKHMDEYYNLPLNLDNGGVHINSSIINHAAYLTGIEIGKPKLAQIYYRALTTYLTPNSTFIDSRHALIQSAVDLYGEGSAEEAAVISAHDRVGITE
ncbi:M4 family metallopeptidase [Fictibacillus fluitans]|uniref:Neutral metalloproteinase n=1 Tax=Fictibacillus fluitans TaxID=3058422 RepID=A0ABT8HQH1_9BACL|nr:M4 family metallopeptidase [Fictibacillus sp. NE201]MDN4523019.1 M4 family metallopeptidase [Fictibacillus sp. NE201]